MDLVEVNENRIVTSSLRVAEVFKKEHRTVIRNIETSTAQNCALLEHVMKSSYTASNGKSNPMYYLDRDAFSFIVMSFTGKEAAQWKWKYIQAFNAMEEQLKNPFMADIPKTLPDALIAYAHALEEKDKALKQIEADKPKVALANAISVSDDDIPVGSMAKVLCQNGYQTGRSRFFAWLRENDFLIKDGKEKNQPRQEWIEKGFFKVCEVPYKIGARTQINIRTYITPKGQEYFIRRLLGGEAA